MFDVSGIYKVDFLIVYENGFIYGVNGCVSYVRNKVFFFFCERV